MDQPFVAVARTGEIAPGKMKRVRAADQDFIIANVQGIHYAVQDLCSHEDYPLSFGCLEGERIKCSLHGSRFCLKTGKPAEEPAEEPIATYRVEIADGQIWLDPSTPTN